MPGPGAKRTLLPSRPCLLSHPFCAPPPSQGGLPPPAARTCVRVKGAPAGARGALGRASCSLDADAESPRARGAPPGKGSSMERWHCAGLGRAAANQRPANSSAARVRGAQSSGSTAQANGNQLGTLVSTSIAKSSSMARHPSPQPPPTPSAHGLRPLPAQLLWPAKSGPSRANPEVRLAGAEA